MIDLSTIFWTLIILFMGVVFLAESFTNRINANIANLHKKIDEMEGS